MLDDAEARLGRAGELKRLVEQAGFTLNGLAPHQKSEVLDLLEIRVTIKGEVPPPRRLECTTTAWFNQRQSVPRELTDDLWAQMSQLINPCVNERVDTYLLTGETGRRDVTCAPHATPKP